MSDLTNETMNPIFAELARELSDPVGSEIAVSEPPEFADLLVDSALSGRHRDSEEAGADASGTESSGIERPDGAVLQTAGRHAQSN
ncbi:hypothetical protein SAMN04487820_10634 [Actinopolyspora mzabensis]|uniref:Uncharacterized protein n=1 Tax=Actinopolyspora mzabensis TaxID=995066 RepID=A0A1G9AGI1_ACTMZ|nr:hypothetical protein [Actinopolyspora mzabensis]SDK26459.1 hypothetical protein SAMN04487820_10634 [Actinopolyspora mzabensis]